MLTQRQDAYRRLIYDYLFVSRPELRDLLDGTRQRIEHLIDSEGPTYIAVLTKLPA